MSTFFLLMFFAMIGLFIVGMIKPRLIIRKDNEKIAKIGYRKSIAITTVLFGFMFFVAFGIASILETPSEQEAKIEQLSGSVEGNESTLSNKVGNHVIELLGEKANTGKKTLIKVTVTQYVGDLLRLYGYKTTDKVFGVQLDINANENLSANLTKGGIYLDAYKLFRDVFQFSPEIGDVQLWFYLPTTDQYGNEKDSVAIKFGMARSLFEKVNWENFRYRTSELPDLVNSATREDLRNQYLETIRFE